MFRTAHRVTVAVSPQETWAVLSGLGGDTGYHFGDTLWRFRGLVDRLAGGNGLRRGRTDPARLVLGHQMDFWRITDVAMEQRLLLEAEMRLPGTATLEFQLSYGNDQQTELRMISTFEPNGLSGKLYWYAVLPLHTLVFAGMLRGIARATGGKLLDGPRSYTPDTA